MKWPFWTRSRAAETENCDVIDPLLSLYADGMASPAEARAVEAHLPACEDCRESLAWMQATRRALAGRPVVTPPADLRARIAAAIAASTDAPAAVPFATRPVPAYRLRPAYAAAASLAVLGLVSYGFLHDGLRHGPPQVAVHSTPAPAKVAVLPPVTAPPAVTVSPPPVTSGPQPQPKPRPASRPRPARPAVLDGDRVAALTPPEEMPSEPPQPKVTAKAAPKAPLLAVKKVRPQPQAVLTATNKPAPTAARPAPSIRHEDRKPDVLVAKVSPPPAPAAVPVIIAPTVIHQDPAPTAVVAAAHEPRLQSADLLGPVKDHLGQMRTATFKTIVRQSDRTYASMTRTHTSEGMAYIDGVHTP